MRQQELSHHGGQEARRKMERAGSRERIQGTPPVNDETSSRQVHLTAPPARDTPSTPATAVQASGQVATVTGQPNLGPSGLLSFLTLQGGLVSPGFVFLPANEALDQITSWKLPLSLTSQSLF